MAVTSQTPSSAAAMCINMLCARGDAYSAGTCLTALLRIETIRWEYCPISGTGQRDRYTGTLGRSRLADAGTATQGPDERIHMRRLGCAYMYMCMCV
jgi:hypothetical protein